MFVDNAKIKIARSGAKGPMRLSRLGEGKAALEALDEATGEWSAVHSAKLADAEDDAGVMSAILGEGCERDDHGHFAPKGHGGEECEHGEAASLLGVKPEDLKKGGRGRG